MPKREGPTPPRTPRARRSPEEARELILSGARKLFAERGPDAVGLKDVAREVGVSHALVSHYFGTYDALVEAAMEAHMHAIRADLLRRVSQKESVDPAAWIEEAFESVSDPAYGRFVAWAILSGKMEHSDFFPRRDRGMKQTADVLEAALAAKGTPTSREELEFAMVAVMTTAVGYALGRGVLWASLGHAPSRALDRSFRDRFAAVMLGSFARSAPAPAPRRATRPASGPAKRR